MSRLHAENHLINRVGWLRAADLARDHEHPHNVLDHDHSHVHDEHHRHGHG